MSSPIEVTRAAESLVRYRRDYRAFVSEQLKIAGQPFRLWPCQVPVLEVVERQLEQQGFVRMVCLKARQVGLSTLAQSLVAWRTMLRPNVNAIVIADEAERSRTLFDICRSFYEQLDDSVRPVGRYISKRELFFANPSQTGRFSDPGLRSRVVVDSAYKKNLAIGASWQIAHLSEAARFKDPAFVIDGVIPAVHRVPGTFIIIESSAEMAGHWYRTFCEQAMQGKNAFEFVFVPWFLQPEYYLCGVCRQDGIRCVNTIHRELMSEPKAVRKLGLSGDEQHMMAEFGLSVGHILWMRAKLLEMGDDWDLFRQSFPLAPDDAWVTPGVQVFPLKQLREQRGNVVPPRRHAEIFPGPRIMDAPQGRLRIWDEPESGKVYDIGADVSLGIGTDNSSSLEDEEESRHLDFSVACVLERGSNKQVAEWVSRIVDPHELATILYWLGVYYNTAQLAVETNGIGGATSSQLSKMGYLNLYCLTPNHRVLTADLRWVPIGDLREGDRLIGFDEKHPGMRRRRRYHPAEVLGIVPRREKVYRVVLSDGTVLHATGEHRWLIFKSQHQSLQVWRETQALRVGDRLPKVFPLWSELATYEAGWLAGLVDGEGSAGYYLGPRPGRGSFSVSVGSVKPGASCLRIRVSHKEEFARLIGMIRPKRVLAAFQPEWLGVVRALAHAIVESVEVVGRRDIVTFGTSTGTYVAEGFASHNCWRYRDELSPRYSKKVGWETSPRSKPWLVSFAVHQLMNNRVVIRSEILYKEMEQYVRKGEREWGAVAGQHDDACSAWMIALLTSDDENFERHFGLRKALEGTLQDRTMVVKHSPESWECDQTFLKSPRTDLVAPWD